MPEAFVVVLAWLSFDIFVYFDVFSLFMIISGKDKEYIEVERVKIIKALFQRSCKEIRLRER